MGRKVKPGQSDSFHDSLEDATQKICVGRFDSIIEAENGAAFIWKRDVGIPAEGIPFPAVRFQCQKGRIVQRNIPVAPAFARTDIDLLFIALNIAKGQSAGFRNPDACREKKLHQRCFQCGIAGSQNL